MYQSDDIVPFRRASSVTKLDAAATNSRVSQGNYFLFNSVNTRCMTFYN